VIDGSRSVSISFTLNGSPVRIDVEPHVTALEMIRSGPGLTGAQEGCSVGECGACTVLVDDVPTVSCLLLAVELEGRRVTTIEATHDADVERVRGAFLREGAFQCGFCTPGMILAASRIPGGASSDDVRTALAGHLCRCTGYASIVRAVSAALADLPSADTEP
jgi:carbon-monoxide dehydrogenase small subunit